MIEYSRLLPRLHDHDTPKGIVVRAGRVHRDGPLVVVGHIPTRCVGSRCADAWHARARHTAMMEMAQKDTPQIVRMEIKAVSSGDIK